MSTAATGSNQLQPGSSPTRTRFSTDTVPVGQKVEAWERHHATSLIGLRTQLHDPGRLRAETATLEWPQLRLAKVLASPHTVRREAEDIAAHPVSGLVAYVPLDGHSTFSHHSGNVDIGPGRLMLCDGDSRFSRDLSQGVNELVIHVPRDTLNGLTGLRSIRYAVAVDLELSPTLSSAAREFVALADSAFGWGCTGSTSENRILDLVTSLVADTVKGRDHLHEAMNAIADGHREPDLSAGVLAGRIGVSERHLSRLFAEVGHSVPQAVLAARLESAQSLLSDPESACIGMAEVAFRSGFRSQAQFSRSYRSRFGMAPLRHRRVLLSVTA
nr:helix-turn-helix domain-containing protein [Brevibacterium marinum]